MSPRGGTLLLSFIVPVYNVEAYLEECLDSLLEKDIPREEYEIICVNDGSTDGSLQLLRRYEQNFPNVRVIDQENSGVCVARNTGLDAVRGEYVWFVDSDDFIAKNCLRELRQIARKTGYDRVNFGTYTFRDSLSREEMECAARETLKPNTYLYNVTVWNNLFCREHLQKNGLKFHPEIRFSEDGIYMLEYVATKPTEIVIDKLCYFYRRREQSLTTSCSVDRETVKIESDYIVVKKVEKFKGSNAVDQVQVANLLMSNYWQMMYSIVNLPKNEIKKELGILRQEKYYPYTSPKECTLIKSYQTTRTDLVGRVFDKIYINLHTRIGFQCMRLWKIVERQKHRLEGRA